MLANEQHIEVNTLLKYTLVVIAKPALLCVIVLCLIRGISMVLFCVVFLGRKCTYYSLGSKKYKSLSNLLHSWAYNYLNGQEQRAAVPTMRLLQQGWPFGQACCIHAREAT